MQVPELVTWNIIFVKDLRELIVPKTTLSIFRDTEIHTATTSYIKVPSAAIQIFLATSCAALVQSHSRSSTSDPSKTVFKFTTTTDII